MHMTFMSPTFYKKKIFFYENQVFFSQHILNKAKIHTGTILLFKVSLGNNLIGFFITVMQKIRNKKVYIQRRNELLN